MPDLMSVQPISGMGNAPRPTPPAPEPAIKKPVDTGASNSSTDYSQSHDHGETAALAQQARRDRGYGEDVLAGPPPSFEASLLEIEGNLEMIIKRLDAARERARDSEAIAAKPPGGAEAEPASDHVTDDGPDMTQGNANPSTVESADKPFQPAPQYAETPADQAG